MALPESLTSFEWPSQGHHRLVTFVGSTAYVLGRLSTSTDTARMAYASDTSGTWSYVNHGTALSAALGAVSMWHDGTNIHIAAVAFTSSADIAIAYCLFNTTTKTFGTWTTIDTNIDPQTTDTNCFVVVRSDGDIIVGVQGDDEVLKGTRYARVDYYISTNGGTSFGAANSLDDGGAVFYKCGGVTIDTSNDDIYMSYTDDAGQNELVKILTSADSLGTAKTVNDTATISTTPSGGNLTYHLHSATDRVTVGWMKDSDSTIYVSEIDSGGTPGAEQAATDEAVDYGVRANFTLVADDTNDDVYCLYIDNATNDVWYTIDDGNGWNLTQTELDDAVTAVDISAYQYLEGNIIRYAYNDNGTVKYNELDLTSGTEFTQSAAGTITPSGALTTQVHKTPTGGLTPSGGLVKQTTKPVSGSLPSSGALVKQSQLTPTGSLTPAGSLIAIKIALQINTGAITPTGALTTQVHKTPVGSISPSGGLVRQAAKPVSGALVPSGSLTKQAQLPPTGGITPAGSLTAIKIALQTNSGTITPSGALVLETLKALAGSTTPSGALVLATLKALAGSIAPSGALVRQTNKPPAGSITPSGTLATMFISGGGTTFFQTNTGGITPAGVLTKQAAISLAGGLTFTGDGVGVLTVAVIATMDISLLTPTMSVSILTPTMSVEILVVQMALELIPQEA